MNTTPDESLLALWLDDELHGQELARVEAWASAQPDQLAAREEIRAFRNMISAAIPAEEEPPYPDFFNSRIEKAIREQTVKPASAAVGKFSLMRSWLFPATAVAGMAMAFWVGTQANRSAAAPSVGKADENGASPVYYTPEQGVDAEWVKGQGSSATVIVLQGVTAIPDALDFSGSVSLQNPNAGESTAGTIISTGGVPER